MLVFLQNKVIKNFILILQEFTFQMICIKSTYSKNPSTSKSTMSFVLFCLFFMFLFILKTNYNACNRCSSDKNKQVPIILT